MYISSTQPVDHLDALPILLDHVLGGDDVTLVEGGDGGRRLLDLAAGCLGGLRSRVLWAAEVLPGIPGRSGDAPGPSRASVADDAVLSQGFRTLTALDPTCDRIVLLVGDAHALQQATLRYIQFVSRCGRHLQLVFCGGGNLLERLDPEEFAWLRARLAAGLVMTLAPPTAKAPSLPPAPPAVAARPAARVGETAVPSPGARRPAAFAGLPSRPLRLRALAVLGVAVLGLGGAAWLAFDMRNGEADRPATGKQATAVVQPPTTPQPPAPSQPVAVSAPATPAPGVPAPHPVMAGDMRGAGPGSPQPPTAAEPPAASEPATQGPATQGPATQGPATQGPATQGPATQGPATQGPATQAPATQAFDGPASHAGSGTGPAAPDAPAPQPPVAATRVPDADPRSASSMPLTPPAPDALVAGWPRIKAGMPGSEPNRQPPPGMAPSLARQGAAAAPSRTAAAAGGRAHKPKETADRLGVPVDDHRPASPPAAGSTEPPGGGSPQYVGSYATGASGVRVFHLEP